MPFGGSPAKAVGAAISGVDSGQPGPVGGRRDSSAGVGGNMPGGALGVIVARPGVGKTMLLVHLALDRLVAGGSVLHVALRDPVAHVRAHYDEALRALTAIDAFGDPRGAAMSAVRNRMIHSWLDKSFDPAALRSHLRVLSEMADFRPELVVVDGLADSTELAGLAALAAEVGVAMWVTLRASDERVQAGVVLELEPIGRSVGLSLTRNGSTTVLPILLDCDTMLLASDPGPDAGELPVAPGDRTLLTGGCTGAEVAFGEAAERWGVREVAFTFEGHRQARTVGSHLLGARELAAGDVSLKYVSLRLRRTYANESGLIRRVLQTLWHMVSRSQQVFVVGQIQPDGTVIGGTGWSVELARMWEREAWVFDQEREAWYRWDGADWVPGEAQITARSFCGTGTRHLNPAGLAAIEDLFRRSFSARAG